MSTLLTPLRNTRQRQFNQFPRKRTWREIRDSLARLEGAETVLFIGTDYDTWLVFAYQGHEFSINDQDAAYAFSVQEADCPEEVIERVSRHFAWLNSSARKPERVR
jgi:hypothetical protein